MKNKKAKTIIKAILLIGVAFIVAIFLLKAFGSAIAKQEVIDCNKWEKEATEFPNYYLLQWQDDQCKAHNIIINTEIKK